MAQRLTEYVLIAHFTPKCHRSNGMREWVIALGDENRLHLLYQMMTAEDPMGIRVGEITKRTNLSRPAVSHHLKLLKDAGVVKVRREGTRNYYYLDPDMRSFKALISVLERSVEYASELPYRGEV